MQCDVVIRLNKILYVQYEYARLWYEKLIDGLLDSGFVVSEVYPCLFMSNTVIYVVYVNDRPFWSHLKSYIDKFHKVFQLLWSQLQLVAIKGRLGL